MEDILYTDPFTLQKDPQKCFNILVDALKNGSLNLIIGAGVSMSTNYEKNKSNEDSKKGFPNWSNLAELCCKKVSVSFDIAKANSNKYILNRLEQVRNSCKSQNISFKSIVKESLFENVTYGKESLKTDLLISIGSFIMNSSKSNLTNVINYNFDDVLEWYLTYYGFDLQIISEINNIIYSPDIVIYHPHGFLPKSELFFDYESEDIILSNKDYVRANWNEEFWNSIQKNIFSNKINLFIGLSGEDTHIESLCQNVYEKIIDRDRIIGVMVLCSKNVNEDIESQNIGNGILTYYIDDYADLPELLLSIVRKARGIE